MLLSFLLLIYSASAQTKSETEQVWNCDAMLAIFDSQVADLMSDEDSLIIVIA